MNFELKTGGMGHGTTITLDGQDFGNAFNVEFECPADGLALLKIHFHQTDENGNVLLGGEGENRHLLTKTVAYHGSFTITGEVEQLVEPTDGD